MIARGRAERQRCLDEQLANARAAGAPPIGPPHFTDGLAWHEFHHKIGVALSHTLIVDGDHIGVGERRGRARLLGESIDEPRVGDQAAGEHLDRHDPVAEVARRGVLEDELLPAIGEELPLDQNRHGARQHAPDRRIGHPRRRQQLLAP